MLNPAFAWGLNNRLFQAPNLTTNDHKTDERAND